ncbi:MAG: SRPBCC domain-containing protein [Myxococcota bacterium]
MLTLSLVIVALAQDPAVDDSSDIVATRVIRAPVERVFEQMLDPRAIAPIAPSTCMRKWAFQETADGEERFQVVYLAELFRRKLKATVTRVDAPRSFDWDHKGNKGFVTRFRFAEVEGGTSVSMHTYIAAPPKPFRNYYANKVQPRWTDCYDRLLEAVADSIE